MSIFTLPNRAQDRGSPRASDKPRSRWSRLADLGLGTKLALSGFVAILITFSAFAALSTWFTSDVFERESIIKMEQQTKSVIDLLVTQDENLRSEADRLSRVFIASLDRMVIATDDTVKVGAIDAPLLRSGGTTLNNNFSAVDSFTATTGAIATLFVKSGDDFVRISTSLKKEDGSRAVGTLLDHAHPAFAKVSRGESYTGKASLFGKTYMTHYQPMLSASGQLIGLYFIGIDFTDALASLKKRIGAIKVGDTGYLFALDRSTGSNRGVMVIHPSREGKNRLDVKDETGRLYIKDMLDAGKGSTHYSIIDKEKNETTARDKVAVFDTFPSWNWLIVASSYESEFVQESVRLRNYLAVGAAVGALLLTALLFALSRVMVVGPLGSAVAVADAIASGKLDNVITVRARDEAGRLLQAMATMQNELLSRQEREQAAAAAERVTANENLRIRNALDNVSSNVMIANNERQIVYVNGTALQMMQAAEGEMRKVLPSFEASRLIGNTIDAFHTAPQHQAQMLETLKSTHQTEIKIGTLTFGLVANPVVNEQGERLGTVVEWRNRTAEVAVEAEVANIVAAAANGDFSQRVVLQGKQGFFKGLAENINQLLQTSSVGLNEVGRVLGALASGDLTQTVEGDFNGTFRKLKEDANTTVTQLTSIVSQIKLASDTINNAAKEIAAGNSDLSVRTEQQAASLEETASSMEELTSTVKQNAENAQKANQLAIGASDIAVRGGQVVSAVVTTMSEINQSSKRIVDIISVIDGIAFQTNILALNAAVEAARAGEQGRGFAVVAAEVRSLAQRSAAAAKEIKALIGDSVEKVGGGSLLVEQAGKTMEEVVSSVKRVTDIMAEITAASQEQSQGIEQVNQTINQMDEVTQQNSALVEEATASAHALEEQAGGLARSVSQFRLSVDNAAESMAPALSVKLPPGQPRHLVAVRPAKPLPAGGRSAAGSAEKGAAGAPARNGKAKAKDQWSSF